MPGGRKQIKSSLNNTACHKSNYSSSSGLHVVLVEPEIPPNTGNVARTCVMTATRLHLVEPLGFSLSAKEVRRSGLDYWQFLDLEVHSNFSVLKTNFPQGRFIFFSTSGKSYYHQVTYRENDFLVFGCETKGLPKAILDEAELTVRIPMVEQIPRSLNLGNSVALVLYEALRQKGFPGMH
jgi:tRNA (cytidine/uridine-2'-O-)-methyltransferase